MSRTRWPRCARRRACGLPLREAAEALGGFSGIKRRFELVGTANGVTVIDDFAHNPDKIAATLETLHAFPGPAAGHVPAARLSARCKLMQDDLIDCFAENLNAGDVLVMPEPVYYGGTAERIVTSDDIVRGRQVRAAATPSPSPTARPAATSWPPSPGPATAS